MLAPKSSLFLRYFRLPVKLIKPCERHKEVTGSHVKVFWHALCGISEPDKPADCNHKLLNGAYLLSWFLTVSNIRYCDEPFASGRPEEYGEGTGWVEQERAEHAWPRESHDNCS